MISPAVMISACGLLLLSTNNKYSLVVNRIRLLNQELRSKELDIARKEVIKRQLPLLLKRMLYIKNAVWLYTLAVIFFVISIILIGVVYGLEIDVKTLVIISFLIGIISLLAGALYCAEETRLGYKIVREIEVGGLMPWD